MALTIQDILDETEGIEIIGPRDKKIFSVCLWREKREICDDVLYVLPTGEIRPDRADICWVMVPQEKISALIFKIQELLRKDYQQSIKMLRLHQAIMEEETADEIAQWCRKIVGNSIWILNANMRAVAFAGSEKKTNSSFAGRKYVTRIGVEPVLLPADNICSCDRIAARIYGKSKIIGFIVILSIERPFSKLDLKYAAELCNVLAGWDFLNDLRNNQDLEVDFVMDLLEGRLTDSVSVSHRREQLHWREHEKYYVLAIDNIIDERTQQVLTELKKIMKQEVYRYGRYYVSIIGCEKWKKLERSDFMELISYLGERRGAAGLSNGYLDLAQTNIALMQAIDSMKIGSLFTDKTVCFSRYEDRIFPFLFQIAEGQNMPLLSLCEPSILMLLEYDQEKKTEYFKTIATFLLNKMRLKETAEQLFVHRNTVYKRISWLREEYHFDFENEWEVAKLQLSILILGYLKLADIGQFADLLELQKHIPEILQK